MSRYAHVQRVGGSLCRMSVNFNVEPGSTTPPAGYEHLAASLFRSLQARGYKFVADVPEHGHLRRLELDAAGAMRLLLSGALPVAKDDRSRVPAGGN